MENMIDFKNLVFDSIDSPINFEELIYEGDGSNSLEDQLMTFKSPDGTEVCFSFDVNCWGRIVTDRGDYWTPPSAEILNMQVEVILKEAFVDGESVEFTGEQFELATKLVEKNI
jgi:hypothetical protein